MLQLLTHKFNEPYRPPDGSNYQGSKSRNNTFEEIPELEDEEEKMMPDSDDEAGMSMIYDEGSVDQKNRQIRQSLLSNQ